MRWNSAYTPAEVAENSTRLKRKFAWVPTHIAGKTVWLETYEILQSWIVKRYEVILDGDKKTFQVGEWVNISTRLI